MSPIFKQILILVFLPSSLLYLLFILPTRPHHAHLRLPPAAPLLHSSPPPPRIAYFISGTVNDGPRIFRLLQAAYHPRNYYLLHLDLAAPGGQREELARMVDSVEVFAAADNVKVVGKADAVNGDGSSPLALVLHGAAVLLRWSDDWDWFVNLDASDYPLIPQDDFLHVMSFVPRSYNFMGYSIDISSTDSQSIMDIIVDPRLYLLTKGKMFMGNKKRAMPDAFKIFMGSPNVILSRKFVEYTIQGWENLPRTLLLYFSNTRCPHKGYFQTLACNSKEFSSTVINSSMRSTGRDQTYEINHSYSIALDFNAIQGAAAFVENVSGDAQLLDLIDSQILQRGRGTVTPGGWCVGWAEWGRDPCLQWGDPLVLRPGPAAERFEKLLLNQIRNTTARSDRCGLV
ncbi:PREDICTED: beta-glucuronosyltransferase GlcAT14B-like [Ipomoea nil]|uniref:beta-glucuronosyltransferase GlcAT14B-like n=1 Tax=Ipomoea nil TaxID=35883 RepID=UPI000901CFA8|nr:PREDICTED: beta-glucuronosyltransferase GlcAT14B-like [Ipomoea nil]